LKPWKEFSRCEWFQKVNAFWKYIVKKCTFFASFLCASKEMKRKSFEGAKRKKKKTTSLSGVSALIARRQVED